MFPRKPDHSMDELTDLMSGASIHTQYGNRHTQYDVNVSMDDLSYAMSQTSPNDKKIIESTLRVLEWELKASYVVVIIGSENNNHLNSGPTVML